MKNTNRSVTALGLAIVLTAQLTGPGPARSDHLDPCRSTASSAAGVHFICPAGDGDPLGDAGLTITVTIRNVLDDPVPGIPAADFWLIGCNNLLLLCGGAASINATAPTDGNGTTTIAGDISGGGCDAGVRVVCQGLVLGGGPCPELCLAIQVRSPDQKDTQGGPPEGVVTTADLAFLATSYQSPPKPYFACHDYVGDPYGTVTAADFAKFGAHYNHQCI